MIVFLNACEAAARDPLVVMLGLFGWPLFFL